MAANPMEDQWDAAAEDARRRLYANSSMAPIVQTEIKLGEEEQDNARSQMLAHILGHYTVSDGVTAACAHVGPDKPNVMFGAACWPAHVFCGPCFQTAWKIYEGFYNRLGQFTPCDNCHGKPCPGNIEGASTGVVNYGPVMLTISLCADCTRNKLEGGD